MIGELVFKKKRNVKCGDLTPILLIGLLLLGACREEKGLKAKMDALMEAEFSPDGPGGCVLVRKEKQIVYLRCMGIADLKRGEKITEETVFNLGSISKTFVAYGILILYERGLLSLEDSLIKYFPDFKNRAIAEKIKIKHLLSHTSGLPDIRKVKEKFEFYLTAKDRENWEPIKGVEKLNFEPGERFEYSNPAFNGLALIIEKITQRPWQEFIVENIFKPAGMTRSKITNGPYPQSGVAHAYILKKGKYEEYDYGEFPTFAAAGNGGVWSSVMDLVKYEDAIQEGKFLSKKLVKLSRTVFHPKNWKDVKEPFVGFSWFIGEEALLGKRKYNLKFIFHTGSQGGFRAFYITIPEKDILFIGLFNRPLSSFKKFIADCLDVILS